MAAKELFNNAHFLSSLSFQNASKDIESIGFLRKSLEEKNRFIPNIDFSNPKNFARYGLAELYYDDSIGYIKNSYPYDGSLKEKLEWELSASYLDKYIFENEYPRTNGYINLGENYGTFNSDQNSYQNFGTANYIFFKGGPHSASSGMSNDPLYKTFSKSNIWHSGSHRESNLEINGNSGLTVEFWFRKFSFISGSESPKQILFDIWNSSSINSASYGRCRVEIRPGVAGQDRQFWVELMSGTQGLTSGTADKTIGIGAGLNLTGSLWNHYALSFVNSGSSMVAKLYNSGTLNDTVTTGSIINLVTGSMIGTIGSLLTSSNGSGSLGHAKLSGSIDEFRYWKVQRTAQDIGRYWFTQVGAGTNTDESNVNLGLYYKFNEGIISTSSINILDRKILDYSGRISNGFWTGYVTGSRSTGSAIIQSNSSQTEFKDPIIYSEHNDLIDLYADKKEIGVYHDTNNNANIYSSIPEWITEEDQQNDKKVLLKMTQTMASYFDNAHIQIESIPKLKHKTYFSASAKPYPFVSRFLESAGLISPDLFEDATNIEYLSDRNEKIIFSEKLSDVKNKIYQNIYNDLTYLYKSKGTEKSFRNILHCFGIDENLIKLNVYANGTTYDLSDRYSYKNTKKKSVNFNDSDRFGVSIYQHNVSSISSSVLRSYIAQPTQSVFNGATYEINVICPKKFANDSELYFETSFTTSSIFGAHTADTTTETDKTWTTPDSGNFRVLLVKPQKDSKDAYFALTGTANFKLPVLTSSIFTNTFDNQKWNLSVKIKPNSFPWGDNISGGLNPNFNIEFSGFNTITDIIENEFTISGSIPYASGSQFMSAPKRFYVGAHRTNFTGSVINNTDIRILSFRVWADYLSRETLLAHAIDSNNFGRQYPYKNAYMTDISGTFGQ